MRLKEARLAAGKTVQDVMEALNVTDAAVYMWEAGGYNPKVSNLVKLSELYGCTVDYLISDSVPQTESKNLDKEEP